MGENTEQNQILVSDTPVNIKSEPYLGGGNVDSMSSHKDSAVPDAPQTSHPDESQNPSGLTGGGTGRDFGRDAKGEITPQKPEDQSVKVSASPLISVALAEKRLKGEPPEIVEAYRFNGKGGFVAVENEHGLFKAFGGDIVLTLSDGRKFVAPKELKGFYEDFGGWSEKADKAAEEREKAETNRLYGSAVVEEKEPSKDEAGKGVRPEERAPESGESLESKMKKPEESHSTGENFTGDKTVHTTQNQPADNEAKQRETEEKKAREGLASNPENKPAPGMGWLGDK